MTHVAITCPRLLFTLGLRVEARPGRHEPVRELAGALELLGGTVTRRADAFTVELVDSIDAVRALQALERSLLHQEIEVQSIVGSAPATELLADPAVAHAWDPLRAKVADEPLDMSRGIAALRHFTQLTMRPVPDEISEDRVPVAPLVLWQVDDNRIVVVDREPFIIGRDPLCDAQVNTDSVSRRHLQITRSNHGWAIHDLESSSGTSLDGRRLRSRAELHAGHVIQFGRPYAFVVLAVQPAS
jgi:hypothetical protein